MSSLTRRRFLAMTSSALAATAAAPLASGENPPVKNPRATDGDDRHEPDWQERLTITVGPEKGDLVGRDDKVIQAAIDYVHRLGGGTVRLLAGEYVLRAAVFLPSGMRLCGSGFDTVITKIASASSPLAADSDWYDQEITLADPGEFRVGDSVVLRAKNAHHDGPVVIKRRLIARSGARFKLDDGLRENLWLAGEPKCESLFPLLTSERTSDVTIEDLALDGNLANNANHEGNYAGCIFLQDCNRFAIRRVAARSYNGDGISFQICHDVRVEDCHSHDHAGLGLHPGSGSQRPVMLRNTLERNNIGLFWCWGVKFGLAENNIIRDNRDYGASIGHNDTDNVMRDNRISGSGKVGILFRDENRGKDFWANRNRIEKNEIVDSGGDDGVAIDVQGQTKDVQITGNNLRETRGPMRRLGIRIGGQAQRIELADNSIEGFAETIRDER